MIEDLTHAGPSTKRRMKTQRRPKLNLIATCVQGAPNASQRTTRVLRKAVERKYRGSLNAKLKRLRKAVPTLLQSHEGSRIGQPKPRKSMVIVAAFNYIKVIERDCNACRRRMMVRGKDANGRRGGWILFLSRLMLDYCSEQ
jgi:hypothetical protein